jgi:hypothetical protein
MFIVSLPHMRKCGHSSLLSWCRREQRHVLSSSLGYAHTDSDASKSKRAKLFCEWLVGAYGQDYLNSGAGVLDVAGRREGGGGSTAMTNCCLSGYSFWSYNRNFGYSRDWLAAAHTEGHFMKLPQPHINWCQSI